MRYWLVQASQVSLGGAAWTATCDGASGAVSFAFSTSVMAVTIRAAIRTAAYRLSSDPSLDPSDYACELAELFDRATASTI